VVLGVVSPFGDSNPTWNHSDNREIDLFRTNFVSKFQLHNLLPLGKLPDTQLLRYHLRLVNRRGQWWAHLKNSFFGLSLPKSERRGNRKVSKLKASAPWPSAAVVIPMDTIILEYCTNTVGISYSIIFPTRKRKFVRGNCAGLKDRRTLGATRMS